MENRSQQGYLVLADISGFTAFFANTELEHAQEILSDLLELIISSLTPVFTLSKLEGDAVFAYTPQARLPRGETVLEIIETTYLAFRDRVDSIHRRTICDCAACRAIPTLDLKFFCHYGSYVMQRVAGNLEIVGSDVNLIHRLLKNHVSEESGWRAYALFSQQSLQQMELMPEGMFALTESYEHLGDVETLSMNLHERHQQMVDARKVIVKPEEATAIVSYDLPIPPAVAWGWCNEPEKRMQWQHGNTWTAQARPAGRTGVGARNHCAHGKHSHIETIIDWRPFDYCTTEGSDPSNPKMHMLMTVKFEPIPTGTRVSMLMRMRMGRLPQWLLRIMAKFVFVNPMLKCYIELGRLLSEQQAQPEEALEAQVASATT